MSANASPGLDTGHVEQLQKLIEQHMSAQTAAGIPEGQGVGSDSKAAFCANWDSAKTVLGALSGLLAVIPGVGVFAGPAIGVVTAAGEAASRAMCKK